MLPALQNLLVLQDRDRRLIRIQAELTAVPSQKLYLKNKASKTTTDFDTAKRQSQLVESDRKRLELYPQRQKSKFLSIGFQFIAESAFSTYKKSNIRKQRLASKPPLRVR